MEIGLSLPQIGDDATSENAIEFAQFAEECGYNSLWVVDHVVLHEDGTNRYPYSRDGELAVPPKDNFLEPLTLLTYIAGATQRIQLATGVLVLPMREPILHAKMIATLDHLSGGRFILGAGVGWWKEEFEVLGVSPRTRGKRMDESLLLLREMWSGEPVHFESSMFKVDGWVSQPTPSRRIPIWLGGENKNQLERVGKYADGWLPTAGKSFETFLSDFEVAKQAAVSAGRDPEELIIAMVGAARISVGRMQDAFERLDELKNAGVSHVSIGARGSLSEQFNAIKEFSTEYLPRLQSND